MPKFKSANDRTASGIIEKWKQTAASQVDDIRGWRDADSEHRFWHYPWIAPKNFFSATQYLVCWLTSNCPRLDPAPVQDIYAAVTAWHEDRNADRVPAQRDLLATLDRAVMVVNAGLEMILSRLIEDQPAHNQEPVGVSLLEVAIAASGGDEEAGKEAKKRWQNLRDPKLPDPIGKHPTHSQTYLYEPSAIVAFVEKVETGDKSQLLDALTAIARPIRTV